RQARIADLHSRVALLVLHARTDLAPVAEFVPEVEPIVELAHAILGRGDLPERYVQIAGLVEDMRVHEPSGRVGKGQVHIASDARVLAYLQIPDQLAPRCSDLGHDDA